MHGVLTVRVFLVLLHINLCVSGVTLSHSPKTNLSCWVGAQATSPLCVTRWQAAGRDRVACRDGERRILST